MTKTFAWPVWLIGIIIALGAKSLVAAEVPPNVLLIIADDQGWGDVPWRGSPARMPHLDQLRKDGLELMRFYTSPVCSPTRAHYRPIGFRHFPNSCAQKNGSVAAL